MTTEGPEGTVVTVVMYHFVQPPDAGPVRGLKILDLEAFRGQLAYIRARYTPISIGDLLRHAIDGFALPPRPIVLTFDDGYRGHHTFVWPALAAAGVPALFFPVASAAIERRILDANKIQCLLAVTDDVGGIVGAIDAAVEAAERGEDLSATAEYRNRWWRATRWDPPAVVYVKRMLQHALPERVRQPLVDTLFRERVSADERGFAEELYMTVDQLRELQAAGMTIGAHGDRHVRLPTLTAEAQAREIDGSLRVLDAIDAARPPFVYCYAYGAHDETSVRLLGQRGCAAAFTTRADLARVRPADMLALPRLDANDLPIDAGAAPNEWTRRASGPRAF
jgi:peptidoglycan/xylan/chitin deacetylase (PgdA/CDA1 family)